MLTIPEILAMPVGELPQALCAQGLAPAFVYQTDVLWHPHLHIDHAWALVELWDLTIEPSLYAHRGAWWIGKEGVCGCYAATFGDIPAGICRAVLLLARQRACMFLQEERSNAPRA